MADRSWASTRFVGCAGLLGGCPRSGELRWWKLRDAEWKLLRAELRAYSSGDFPDSQSPLLARGVVTADPHCLTHFERPGGFARRAAGGEGPVVPTKLAAAAGRWSSASDLQRQHPPKAFRACPDAGPALAKLHWDWSPQAIPASEAEPAAPQAELMLSRA
jgi:hypothetical protein